MAFKSMDEVRAAHPRWFEDTCLRVLPQFGKVLFGGRFFVASSLVPYLPEYGPAKEIRVMHPSPITGEPMECVRRHVIYEVRSEGIDAAYYFGTFSRSSTAAKALTKKLRERPDLAAV